MLTATVAIPTPLRTLFHYKVAENMDPSARVGCRVLAPFGRRKIVGYIVARNEPPPESMKLRSLLRILDLDEPTFAESMVSFLLWMANYYHAPPGEVFRIAHPAGTNEKSTPGLALGPQAGQELLRATLEPAAIELLEYLRKAEAPQPISGLPGSPNDSTLRKWVEMGLFQRTAIEVAPRVEARTERAFRATSEPPRLPRGPGGRMLKRDEIHSWLMGRSAVLASEIRKHFPSGTSHLRQLVEEGAVVVEHVEVLRDPFFGEPVTRDKAPELRSAQAAAVRAINAADGYQGFLLHGITGSGKTEVYLHAIEERLKRGEGALVLVPEIALTPQLVRRFRARLGDSIAVLHSGLGDGARFDQWRRLRRGELSVAIGARSGVFAPVKNLGLIIVDEEHDPSFKQGDGVRYQGRDMALMRGFRAGATVVLGSATPSLESLHNVESGRLTQLDLPERATGGQLPTVELIDLKTVEPPEDGERYLSKPVREALESTLRRGEQSIVFLNRRGFSSFVMCTDCGEVIECNQCAISMTWHKRRNVLHCHYCDAVRPIPDRCPTCGGEHLETMGKGTERVEERIQALFPDARVARLDRDTAGGRRLEQILGAMRERKIDILVGTQMVTKGHDFPFVTTVAVLDADSGLNFPDFRAGERTLQLLTQVAGRAGRAQRPGRVLVQTWDPSHIGLKALTTHDHMSFCQEESSMRQLMGYPPYAYAAVVRVEGRNPAKVKGLIGFMGDRLREAGAGRDGCSSIRGPAPAVLERIRGRTRHALMITARDRRRLHELTGLIESIEGSGHDLRVIIDIDPYDLL